MSNRVMYLRDGKFQPVGCIAIRLNPRTQFVEYAISVLNPVDKFDRKMARQLAIGRLSENPETLVVPRNPTIHVISLAVMRDLSSRKTVPGRAQRAAKLWLAYNEWQVTDRY